MSSRALQRRESSVSIQHCPECNGDLVQTEQETHCESCGLVVKDAPVDYGPEWRSFDREERKRTGAPRTVTRHDRGLSTEMGFPSEVDSSSRRRRLNRQRRLHGRAKFESKRERNLAHGLGEVRRLVGALGQSKTVQEQAAKLLREAQDADLFLGHSLESAAAAMVYAAGRCNTVIRMADVAAVAQCSEQEAWRTYRTFQTELEIPIPVQLPVDWVPKIVSELPYSVPSAVQQHATQVAAKASESAKLNGSPVGIAAASVYLAGEDADIRLTQQVVSGAADISTVTLRTWYQRLVALFDA